MSTAKFRRATRVRAPLSEVWDFHSGVEGLDLVTPLWMNLRVERVVGPDGQLEPEILEAGTKIKLSVRPFGIGPRQSWTSHVTDRAEGDGRAFFRDEMESGPFDHWVHTHSFFADDEGGEAATVVLDRIEYRLPGGWLGESVSPLAVVGLEPMFRYRHHMTRTLLE